MSLFGQKILFFVSLTLSETEGRVHAGEILKVASEVYDMAAGNDRG